MIKKVSLAFINLLSILLEKLKLKLTNKKNQVLIILILTILISLVSGIHRALISLLYELFSRNAGSIYDYNIDNAAPLMVWVQLAFTVAPFGLAKAITDYYSGSFTKTKKVLFIGIGSYLSGVFTISFLIISTGSLQQSLSQILLPLSSGFVGAGEGFFYASIQILLSNYASKHQRGQFLGFSEFSIYGGYTLGSVLAGYLSNGSNFLVPYSFSFLIIILTIFLNIRLLREYSGNLTSKTKNRDDLELELRQARIKAKFKPKKLVKNIRTLSLLIGTHFSKWGDALILMLPIYFGWLLSSQSTGIIPDTLKISFILGFYTSSWAIGMFFTSYLTEHVGRRFPTIFGLFLSGMGFISLIFVPKGQFLTFELISISMAFSGLGTGLYYPLLPAIGLDIAKPKFQAQTLALFRSIRDFGYFTGPFVLAFFIWTTGSTVNNLLFASVFVGLLLISIAILFSFILKETRPSWPFFDGFVSHAFTIKKVVDKSVTTFNFKLIKDIANEKIISRSEKAKLIEKKADSKKRNLIKNLSTSVRKTDDVTDFYQLIKVIDEIGGKTSMAALKYSKLVGLYPRIPSNIFTCLQELADCLPPMMDELLDAIDLLDEQVSLAHKSQKILANKEQQIDRLYDQYLKLLYSSEKFLVDNEKFTIMMTLKEVGENLEKASDLIQDAGDLLTIIALKHKL